MFGDVCLKVTQEANLICEKEINKIILEVSYSFKLYGHPQRGPFDRDNL